MPPAGARRRRLAATVGLTALVLAGATSFGAGEMLVQGFDSDCDAPATKEAAGVTEPCHADGAKTATKSTAGNETPGEERGPRQDARPGRGAARATTAGGRLYDRTNDESADTDRERSRERDSAPVAFVSASASDRRPSGGASGEAEENEIDDRGLDPEAGASATLATSALHRIRPGPPPAAGVLRPGFATMLAAESRRAGVEWADVLAAVRADGRATAWPASRARVRALARGLEPLARGAREWQAFLTLGGRAGFADRATALADYNRAVGLRALVKGLEAAKPELEDAVLADDRLDIYAGGRRDVASHGVDVRVLALLRYVAETFGQVTVSSLRSGHRLYARPGVVSAHVYGLAVDVSAVGRASILGNSAPGGVTAYAVREILLLPKGLRPKQVVSLLGLGGPSFRMRDHADHIHIGY